MILPAVWVFEAPQFVGCNTYHIAVKYQVHRQVINSSLLHARMAFFTTLLSHSCLCSAYRQPYNVAGKLKAVAAAVMGTVGLGCSRVCKSVMLTRYPRFCRGYCHH